MSIHGILIAVDPGKTGAIAVFRDGKLIQVCDPDAGGSLAPGLADLLIDYLDDPIQVVEVVIERVNGMPGQSGPGSFNFGMRYGELRGVCTALGVKPHLVPPALWKPYMGLHRAGFATASQYKAASVKAAKDRWGPEFFNLAKHDGRAEAALLGAYWLSGEERTKHL